MWRYKTRELLYFWVDYIKAFFKDILDKDNILLTLSSNSNQYFFSYLWNNFILTKQKYNNDGFTKYYSIQTEKAISIAFIILDNKQWKNFIEITGQGLTLFWTDVYYFLMKEFNLSFIKYKRIDICFDMKININYFYNTILDDKYKTREFKKNNKIIETIKNWIETIYFWKTNIKENSYILNRVYNKIIDSKKKWKLFLYEDKYKTENGFYKEVTRFETEIREDLAKFYKYDDLKNEDFLFFRIVKSFYKYNSQFFKFMKKEDFIKFIDDFKELKKKEKKETKEKILNWEKAEPMTKAQLKLIKTVEALELQNKYWNDIVDNVELEHTKQMAHSYLKKLIKFWYTKDKIFDFLSTLDNYFLKE